mmetsp:Transcript_83748/g.187334  ORF Transcript_83748/g.187334 Transcript_83748/m.187334 type:complete len:351 (-) Transcript_83748:30-1082(-)
MRPKEFVQYMAEVTMHAHAIWGWPVRSLAPFNEPSAGWWTFPKDQEGCNIGCDTQLDVTQELHAELTKRELKLGPSNVLIACSDENRIDTALRTWRKFKEGQVGEVGRINVHSYIGLDPAREETFPGQRGALALAASEKSVPIWVSEHGTGEKNGLDLAQTILEDLHYLRPTAWCYWQPVEHKCSWGFIEADFGGAPEAPTGGKELPKKSVTALGLPHPKHYVFLHFSHYIRPGSIMLRCSEPWAAAALVSKEAIACTQAAKDAPKNALVCVLLNAGRERWLRLTLPRNFRADDAAELEAVLTQPSFRRFFVACEAHLQIAGFQTEVLVWADEASVCSVVVPGTVLEGEM